MFLSDLPSVHLLKYLSTACSVPGNAGMQITHAHEAYCVGGEMSAVREKHRRHKKLDLE